MSPMISIRKSYPSHILTESFSINASESLETSLSGTLEDYTIQTSESGLHISAEAIKSYQERYRSAASAEKRLSKVESELQIHKQMHKSELQIHKQMHKSKLQMLKDELQMLKGELQAVVKDKVYTQTVLLRSQIYSRLLLIVQKQLFDSLTNQEELRNCGLADLPRMFAIWWTAWNSRHPENFPLPAYMSGLDLAIPLPSGNFLFNYRSGGESETGAVLRNAWETLGRSDSIDRDFMMHCWCVKMSGINIRNLITVTLKKEAEEILRNDLQNDSELRYLYSFAMSKVSGAPETFVL